MTEHIGSEYVEVLPDATGFVRKFQEQTGTGMTEAGRRAGNEWQRGFQVGAGRPTIRPDVDTAPARAELARLNQQGSRETRGLMGVLVALAPAVAPLAGAAAIAGAALVSLGVDGALAIKGASAEMKAGTQEGLRFAAGVATIKSDVAGLSKTAAGGVLTPFERTISRLHASMPAFNLDVAQSSRLLGDIGGHLVTAAVAGEHTFAPAMLGAERTIDQLSARFEHWATGPGGAQFADTLARDFREVEPAIEDVAGAVGHLVAAANTPGLGIVHELDLLARVLDNIPEPVLSALVTGIVGLKVAGLVTGLMDKLALSITRVAVAEEEGAVASSTFRSRLGAGVGLVGKIGAGLLVAGIATSSLADATEDWRTSTSATKNIIYNIGQTAKDLFSFNWGNLGHDIIGLPAEEQARNARLRALQSTLYNAGAGLAGAGSPTPKLFSELSGEPQGFDPAADRAKIADLGNRLAPLRAIMDHTVASMHRLGDEQRHLAETGQLSSAAYQRIQRELLEVSAHGDKAANTYQHLLTRITSVSQELQDYQRAQRAFRATASAEADRYAGDQATRIGDLHFNTFNQNPGITAGATALAAYQTTVEKAIKSEEKWTAVGDEQRVHFKLNGQAYTFSAKAYSAALNATGNNAAKAAGLLVGHARALDTDRAAADQAATESRRLTGDIGAAEAKYKLTDEQLSVYSATIGITSQMLADGEVSQRGFTAAIGAVQHVIDNGSTAMQGWVAAVAAFASGTDTAASRGQLLGSALVSLNGDTLAYADTMAGAAAANQQFVTDFNAADKAVVNLKRGTIDYHNAAAKPLLDDLSAMQQSTQQAAAATYQHEIAMGRSKQAAVDAASVYYNDTRNALISEHDQLGLTVGQAKKLADQYFSLPKDVKTQIALLGGDTTQSFLKGILEDLDQITGNHHAVLNVDAYLSPNAVRAQKLMDSAGVTRILINPQTGLPQGNTGADGYIGYAGGGIEDHRPGIYRPIAGRVRVFAEPETRGEAYVPLANDWRRPRAKSILTEVARRFGGAAFFAAGGGPGEDGGFTGVNDGSGSGSGSGPSSSSSSPTASDKAKAAADKAQAKLDAARSSARSDLQAFLSAIGITTNAITAAEHTLTDALTSAKVSTSELAKVARETHRLVGIAHAITTETERISKAQTHLSTVEQHQQQVQQAARQEGASVRDSIISFLDLSSAGVQQQVYRDRPAAPLSAQSILRDVRSAANKGVATEDELGKLKGHIPDSLYQQLAGNAAQDQPQIEALAAGPQKTRDAIAREYERLRKAGKGAGADVVDELFGGKLDKAGHAVDIAKGLLNGVDPDKNKGLAKAVGKLSDRLFGAGKETAKGLAEGLIAERSGLRRQLRSLGHEVAQEIRDDLAGRNPHHGGGGTNNDARTGGRGGTARATINFNGPVNDVHAVTHAVDYALVKAIRRGRH